LEEKHELYGATGKASVEEIEEFNIVGATCLAMKRAMDGVSDKSDGIWKPLQKSTLGMFEEKDENEKGWAVLVDGRPMKKLPYEHLGLVKGDTISLAIAMASMLAKVTRDRLMRDLHTQFPEFGFNSNKGYGAPIHLRALEQLGPTIHHRPRFLRNILPGNSHPTDSEAVQQSQLSFL
jgi:ribonuclease HII